MNELPEESGNAPVAGRHMTLLAYMVLVGILVVFGSMMFFNRGKPAERKLRALVDILEREDAHELASWISEKELKGFGVDRSAAETFFRKYFFAHCRLDKSSVTYSLLEGDDLGSEVHMTLVSNHGRKHAFGWMIGGKEIFGNYDPSSLRDQTLGMFFDTTCLLMYEVHDGKSTDLSRCEAYLNFARNEREGLKQLGFLGMWSSYGGSMSFIEMEGLQVRAMRSIKARLASEKAKAAAKPATPGAPTPGVGSPF